MKRLHAALALAAGVALSRADCSIDAFCKEGASDCVDPGCHDRVQNGDETDVDCGGSCSPCALESACNAGSDCDSDRCVAGRCCSAPCGLWSKSFGSLGYDNAGRVAIAPDGSIYVAGVFSGIVDFGGGPLTSAGGHDLFLLKLDANGNHVWSLRFGGTLDDDGVSIALTAAGHPVLAITSYNAALDLGGGPRNGDGSSAETLYFAELDSSGKHVWSRAYDGTIEASQLAIAPSGQLVIVGAIGGTVDLGPAGKLTSAGSVDVLLAQFDATGEPVKAKRFGSVWGDQGEQVAVGADGSIYIAVRYSRSWSFGGGAPLPNSNGEFSIGVAKFKDDLTVRWSHGYPNGTSHYATGLALDDRGSLWLSGAISGSLDFGTGPLPAAIGGSALVARLDPESGNTLWAHSYGEHTMASNGVASDGQGGVLFSGVFKGNADFGNGVLLTAGTGQPYVARLDVDGNALWARALDGVGDFATLAATPAGDRFVVSGAYRGTFDAGTGPLPSAGESDGFVAALLP